MSYVYSFLGTASLIAFTMDAKKKKFPVPNFSLFTSLAFVHSSNMVDLPIRRGCFLIALLFYPRHDMVAKCSRYYPIRGRRGDNDT